MNTLRGRRKSFTVLDWEAAMPQNRISQQHEIHRSADRDIEGRVIEYGDRAQVFGFHESFAPGAFAQLDDVLMHLHHDRQKPIVRTGAGLTLTDSPEALDFRATIPDTAPGREALELIDAGVVTDLSVEFDPIRVRQQERNVQIVRAKLNGIGLVTRGAYKASKLRGDEDLLRGAEIRLRQRGVSGVIRYGVPGIVSMVHRQAVVYERGSIETPMDVVLLDGYDYNRALASTASGQLAVEATDQGVEFRAQKFAATTAARDVRAKMKAGLVRGVVPGLFVREKRDEKLPLMGVEFDLTRIVSADLCELNLTGHSPAFAAL